MLSIRVNMRGNRSLKEKRRVVRGMLDRTRARFNAAVAEVGDLDMHATALLGVACVSNSASHADSVLDNVIAFMASAYPEAEVSPESRELIHW